MEEVVNEIDTHSVDRIIERSGADPEALIGILQDIQAEWNFLPLPALKHVAEKLDVPYNRVWAVATFYEAFSLEPRGRHHLQVCAGTACHARNGADIIRVFEDELMIDAGQTTPDGEFSLECAHCLGGCAVGPTVMVNEVYYGRMTRQKVLELLDSLRKGKEIDS